MNISIKLVCSLLYKATHGTVPNSHVKRKRVWLTNFFFLFFFIVKVGPTYGRKTMTGLLAADGFKVAEKRVGVSLKKVCSAYHNRRVASTQSLINPIPYSAKYFGEKLHIDQNEKMVQFGVTHVCAVDGFSGMIVGFVTMPIKNNRIIYEFLYM